MFDNPLRTYLRECLGLRGTPLNLLFTIIRFSQNERGHCWARLVVLGERIERAARTARAALKTLRDKGFVHTASTGRNLICTPVWERLGLDPKTAAPPAASTGREQETKQSAEQDPMRPGTKQSAEPGTEQPGDRATEQGEASGTRESRADDRPNPGAGDAATKTTVDPAAPAQADNEPALTAIRARFGEDAARDVAALLNGEFRGASPEAARAALDRMATVDPQHIRHTVGGYFRRLFQVASEGRLSPSSSCKAQAPPSAPDALDQAVKAQSDLVYALEQRIARTELISDERTRLTHQMHCAIEKLATLHRRKDARDHPPIETARMEKPPTLPRPRTTKPPPDWAVKLIPAAALGGPAPP